MTAVIAAMGCWTLAASCGSSSDGGGGGGGTTGDGAAPDSMGVDAAPFKTADHPALPRMVNHGGLVLKTPKLLALTYANDPLRAQTDAFTKALPTLTAYWDSTVAEYGVGTVSFGGTAHLKANAPATISDEDVQNLIKALVTGAEPALGAPDPNTIYTLFLPRGVKGVVSATTYPNSDHAAKLCVSTAGYHASFLIGQTPIAYTIIPLCPASLYDLNFGILNDVEARSGIASHEWIEAMTNPFQLLGKPGWFGLDPDHGIWAIGRSGADDDGSENADLCHLRIAEYPLVTAPDGNKYRVQRGWSNKESALGRHYCAPARTRRSASRSPSASRRRATSFSTATAPPSPGRWRVRRRTSSRPLSRSFQARPTKTAPARTWSASACGFPLFR